MEEPKKLDLKQYTAKPVSKKYLARIIIYTLLLVGVCFAIYYMRSNTVRPELQESSDVQEINGITIIPSESVD